MQTKVKGAILFGCTVSSVSMWINLKSVSFSEVYFDLNSWGQFYVAHTAPSVYSAALLSIDSPIKVG